MRAAWLRVNFIYIFCLSAGFAVYGGPRGPDAPQTWWQVAGAGLLTAAFSLCAYAAGWLAGRRGFRTPPVFVLDLALGLALLSAWAQVVGLFAGLGYFPNPWFTPVFLLPLLASLDPRWLRPGRLPGFSWPLTFLAVTFLLLFLVACLPDPMPDPLWYNLTSARWWTDAGRVYFPRENVALLAAGSWDALYLWPTYFLGGAAGGGLIATQIAAQWMHLLLGGLGTALALRLFFRRLFPALRPDALWLVVLVACLSASQQTSIFLAKNDWGASLWLLSALLALPEHAFLAGIFWGFALSAKLTVLFIGVPLLVWLVRTNRRAWAHIFLGGCLGAAPFLWRNFAFTGDPFFPVFLRRFHHADLAELWHRTTGYDGGAWLSFSGRGPLLKLLLADSPFLWLTVAALIFAAAGPRRLREPARFCAVVIFAALFFVFKVGSQAEFRLFGLGCLLLAGSGLAFFLAWAESKDFPWAAGGIARKAGALVLFFAAAISTSYPWRAPLDLMRAPSPPEVIRQHFGGRAEAWIRLNLPPGTGVAGANEVRLYYLSELRAYRIWDNVDLDRQIRQARSLREVVTEMRASGIQYLIFTRLDWDRYFRQDVLDALESAWGRHRAVIVFDSANSKVIDLARLAEALRENDISLPGRDW